MEVAVQGKGVLYKKSNKRTSNIPILRAFPPHNLFFVLFRIFRQYIGQKKKIDQKIGTFRISPTARSIFFNLYLF
jgi:hypothetical protein